MDSKELLRKRLSYAMIREGLTFSIEENPIIMREVPLNDVIQVILAELD